MNKSDVYKPIDCGRNLLLTRNDTGWVYAEFNSNGRRRRRLLTPSEVERAEKIIDTGDPWQIDDFCYSL